MMLLRKRTIFGLFLCTLVFSSSIPLLLGIQASPAEVFGEEIITISQVNSSVALNATLAADLSDDANQSVLASAEIYAFSVIQGVPVVVRGVDLDNFMAIENGTIIDGIVNDKEHFTVIGKDLSRRSGLGVNDSFVLTGSSNPAIFQMKIDAVYTGEMGSDSLLIPLSRARKIAGLGTTNAVSVIRVKTTNQTALVEEIVESEAPVVISEPGEVSEVVNANISEEERAQQSLALAHLDNMEFKASNGSYVSLFVQEGESSVRVVIMTFLFLDGALTFIGASAILARAIIERRHDIGILSAIGADRKFIRLQIAKDILLISVPASLLGVLGGLVIVRLIENSGLLLMFGQTINPLLSQGVLIGTFVATILICVISGIVVNEVIMRATPQSMMQDTEKAIDEEHCLTLVACLEVGE